MILVNTKNIFELKSELLNKQVLFKSDCEFFPNFSVQCKVTNIYIRDTEIMFDVIESTKKKKLTIGSKMKNLQYDIL